MWRLASSLTRHAIDADSAQTFWARIRLWDSMHSNTKSVLLQTTELNFNYFIFVCRRSQQFSLLLQSAIFPFFTDENDISAAQFDTETTNIRNNFPSFSIFIRHLLVLPECTKHIKKPMHFHSGDKPKTNKWMEHDEPPHRVWRAHCGNSLSFSFTIKCCCWSDCYRTALSKEIVKMTQMRWRRRRGKTVKWMKVLRHSMHGLVSCSERGKTQ